MAKKQPKKRPDRDCEIIRVPLVFRGEMEVQVPLEVPAERRKILARKIALSRVLAVDENPDGPEEEACLEYQGVCHLEDETAEADWDSVETAGVTGKWQEAWPRRPKRS